MEAGKRPSLFARSNGRSTRIMILLNKQGGGKFEATSEIRLGGRVENPRIGGKAEMDDASESANGSSATLRGVMKTGEGEAQGKGGKEKRESPLHFLTKSSPPCQIVIDEKRWVQSQKKRGKVRATRGRESDGG